MTNADLVEINDKNFIISLMYAGKENMTLCPVYEKIGFGNKALVRPELWACLKKIIPYLERHRLKMKICDAYRPPIAHMILKDIIPADGFFAPTPERSLHCHGTAIDCCLTDEDGNELSYPCKVDAFDQTFALQLQKGISAPFMQHLQKARHDYTDAAMPEQIANREELKRLMESAGFESLMHEWWHYNLKNGKDFPLIEWEQDA